MPSRSVKALQRAALRAATAVVTAIYGVYRLHPALWRFTARHYHPALETFARLNAWMVCQRAYVDVPAYRAYLDEAGFSFRWWSLRNYRPTSKHDYVDRYEEHERCWHGEIVTVGTVVDESSGSSGTPYNWMRSKRELDTVHKNVAGYVTLLFGTKRLFCINAFSMGAWATGTNTGLAMSKIAMVKNTGPDIEKIVDTLKHFGPRYTYLISAYPPFLKHLRDRLDAEGFDWDGHDLNGFVGGEALTEALRDYIEDRFTRVYSGYGASDLTIGMAGESDLSVWLRRALVSHPDLRTDVLGDHEQRPIIHLQLRKDASLSDAERDDLRTRSAAGVLTHLARVSRDVAQSLEEDPTASDVRVEVHDYGTGVFEGGSSKIKNVYLVDAGDRV